MTVKQGYRKITVPIEDVQLGNIDPETGLEVVETLHRNSARYVRCTLGGGWPIIDGYFGDRVTVKRRRGDSVC